MSSPLAGPLLDLLEAGSRSCGDLTRLLMAAAIVPNQPQSYADVKAALLLLLAEGKVSKAGNGKSVHWKLVAQ